LEHGSSEPVFLDDLPFVIPEPVPESLEIDEDQLFTTGDANNGSPGLHLACYEGHCLMDDISLGAGEAAYASADGRTKVRVDLIPPFLADDPYFETVDFDPDLFDLLNEEIGDGVFECTVAD
jgi:hypothetical protein